MKIKDIKNPRIRAKALEYAREDFEHENKSTKRILELDIGNAFCWASTEEGEDFWLDVYEGIEPAEAPTLDISLIAWMGTVFLFGLACGVGIGILI